MDNKKIMKRATDELMSLAELKEDLYFKKIPDDKVKYYVNESIKIGQEEARNILNTYEGKSVIEICKEKKIRLDKPDEEYDFEIVRLRAKYDSDIQSIILYDLSIKKVESALNDSKVGLKFAYDEIKEMQIAHELYHYLEDKEIGATYEKLDDIRVFLTKRYPVMKCSDIAAHIFCKELLKLSFHPKILDYFYLVGTGYADVVFLENYLSELEIIANN